MQYFLLICFVEQLAPVIIDNFATGQVRTDKSQTKKSELESKYNIINRNGVFYFGNTRFTYLRT